MLAAHHRAAWPDPAATEQHHHGAGKRAGDDGGNEQTFDHAIYYTLVGDVIPVVRRALGRRAALLALFVIFALALPAGASAHAYLVRSAPDAGSRLERAPEVLVLYFSEPFVEGTDRISLRRPDGEHIAAPSASRRGTVVRQPLPTGLRGIVVVHWSVLADDGHPSLGEFAFAIGDTDELPQLSAAASSSTPWGQTVAVWLFFAGLALALGGLVSERFIWRGAGGDDGVSAAPVGLGLFIAVNGALLHLLLLAADRAGALAEVRSPADLELALETRAGRLTLAIVALLAAAVVLTRLRRLRPVAIAVLLIATVASAARGHSGGSDYVWAVPADALHIAAAAIWVGALVHLVRVLHGARAGERRETLARGARRYASIAVATVAVAVTGGLLTALAQFGSLDELLETGYGRTLVVKGALIAVALAVALTARTQALGLPWPAPPVLRRGGVFELGMGATVLLLLALLVGSSPLRLISSLLFVATLAGCAVALRRGLQVSKGGAGPLVAAAATAVVAINAGIVAFGAAFVQDGLASGDSSMVGVRITLAVAAAGLALGAVVRGVSHGPPLRIGLLRRLPTAEAAVLVAALLTASFLVTAVPPRASGAANLQAELGPPPLRGPAIRLADFVGQIAVGVAVHERGLRFRVVVPGEEPSGLRLTAEARPPGALSADLYPRPCGPGCFTIRYRIPRGRTIVTAEVGAPGFEGGRARFVVTWPPAPERHALLRRVAQTMAAVREVEMSELVVSGGRSRRVPFVYRVSGQQLLTAEMYRGGGVDVRAVGRKGDLTELVFALPASDIWYRMWIDPRSRVRREVIVNRGHRITRTFKYPST